MRGNPFESCTVRCLCVIFVILMVLGGLTYWLFRDDFERRDDEGMRNYGTNGGVLP